MDLPVVVFQEPPAAVSGLIASSCMERSDQVTVSEPTVVVCERWGFSYRYVLASDGRATRVQVTIRGFRPDQEQRAYERQVRLLERLRDRSAGTAR